MRVIDTATASAAIAMLALAIQRRLERGTTDEEIDELVARFKREAGLVFTLDTLEYLARGGRIGRAAGWAGQLLHIKPILTLADGEVLPLKRVRGNRKAIQEFADALRDGTRRRAGPARGHRPRGSARPRGRRSRSSSATSAAGGDRGRDDARPGRRHPRRPGNRRPLLAPRLLTGPNASCLDATSIERRNPKARG